MNEEKIADLKVLIVKLLNVKTEHHYESKYVGAAIAYLTDYLDRVTEQATPQSANARVRELERTLELFRAATSQELHERIAEIMKKKIK